MYKKLIVLVAMNLLLVIGRAMAADSDFPGLLDTLRDNGTLTQKQYDKLLQEADSGSGNDVKVSTKGGIEAASYDGQFSFQLSGRIMADMAFYGADKNPLGDGTELRRARFEAEGTLYSNWEYELGVDFAEGDADVKDAYVRYVFNPSLKLTIGQFKEPFSLEELTSSKYITFMERALPNEFASGRNMGIGLHSWGHKWTAGIGLFGDDFGTNKNNTEDNLGINGDEGWGVTARFTLAPFHDERKVLHIGIAASHREPDDEEVVKFDSRPESHVTNVKYVNTDDILAVDDTCRYGGELAVVYGPISVQGEYIHAEVRCQSGQPDVGFDGYYIYGSWFLTGESRNYKVKKGAFGRVRPREMFGAFELAARYSELDLNDGPVTGGEEKNITIGLNWYANSHTRVMANYILVDNDDYADDIGGVIGNDDPKIFQMRFQIDF